MIYGRSVGFCRYSNKTDRHDITEILLNVEKEITDFSRQGQIILGGDLIARTGSLPDFIAEDNDDHLSFLMITTQREK